VSTRTHQHPMSEVKQTQCERAITADYDLANRRNPSSRNSWSEGSSGGSILRHNAGPRQAPHSDEIVDLRHVVCGHTFLPAALMVESQVPYIAEAGKCMVAHDAGKIPQARPNDSNADQAARDQLTYCLQLNVLPRQPRCNFRAMA
jgi:hypothetical protein